MFLDKVLFDKTKAPMLTAVLDVTQLRQRVMADNIANVSTRGFRRKEVRFEEYLNSKRTPTISERLGAAPGD